MKKLWLIGLLPVMVACGNNSNSEPTQFEFEGNETEQSANVEGNELNIDEGEGMMIEVDEGGNVVPKAGTATPNVGASGDANPPHGEPGHRCDIPVGAPLSSAPASPGAASAAPQIQQVPNPGAAPAGPSAASGKANPAHGQPGHRCDIPVGSPLP